MERAWGHIELTKKDIQELLEHPNIEWIHVGDIHIQFKGKTRYEIVKKGERQ